MAITERDNLIQDNDERELRFDRDGETLIFVDRRHNTYSAYWFSPFDLNGFVDLIHADPNISGAARAEAVLKPEHEEGKRIYRSIGNILSHSDFPEDCIYFSVKASSYDIAWEQEEFGNGNEITVSSDDLDPSPLLVYYWVTFGVKLTAEEARMIFARLVVFIKDDGSELRERISDSSVSLDNLLSDYFTEELSDLR